MLEELKKMYRAEFFENSEMLISIYDKDLNLIDANNAFLVALKFKKEDILGKNINVISPDCKSSGRYAIYEEVIKTGKPFVSNQVRLHPSLGSLYIRLSAFKVGDGLGISSKDITDLIETIQDLETFIYKTSHDIRSPITTTLGLLNLAKLEPQAKDALPYFDMIQKQIELLDYIVTKLVETTNIRKGTKTVQLIDFNEELNKVLDELKKMPGFEQLQVRLHTNPMARLYSDHNLINATLQNLVQNAIKYRDTKKPSSLLHITVTPTDTGVKVSIEDNGIGIPEQAQTEVFKMFFRASSQASGSGLGLYMVKNFVKQLGGQISLHSVDGEGSRFDLYLPNLRPDLNG